MKTLVILSSILGDRSNSKQLADHLLARLKQSEPGGMVKIRDLAADPVPYFDGATVGALFTPASGRRATPATPGSARSGSFRPTMRPPRSRAPAAPPASA